jgi:hypothetical protein
MFEVGEGEKSPFQRFLQFLPVTGSRELERKVAKLGVGFRDNQ